MFQWAEIPLVDLAQKVYLPLNAMVPIIATIESHDCRYTKNYPLTLTVVTPLFNCALLLPPLQLEDHYSCLGSATATMVVEMITTRLGDIGTTHSLLLPSTNIAVWHSRSRAFSLSEK